MGGLGGFVGSCLVCNWLARSGVVFRVWPRVGVYSLGLACSGLSQYGLAWVGAGLAWAGSGLACLGLAWLGVVRFDMVFAGLIWCGPARPDQL